MHDRSDGARASTQRHGDEREFIMKRMLSIVATLAVLAAAAPRMASAQYDTTGTNRTGTMSSPNTTTPDNNMNNMNSTSPTRSSTRDNTAYPNNTGTTSGTN